MDRDRRNMKDIGWREGFTDTMSVFENPINVYSLVIYDIIYGIVEKFSIIYKCRYS